MELSCVKILNITTYCEREFQYSCGPVTWVLQEVFIYHGSITACHFNSLRKNATSNITTGKANSPFQTGRLRREEV